MLITPPKPHALPQIGAVFGGYRIERELGRGGMGAVYAAEQLSSGRRVALKVLSHQLDSPDARARFLREGRLAASINHPNSVYVFGTEEIDDTPVIAMELIAGGTLQDRIQRFGPLPIGAAVDAVLQIIAGLEAAHSVGILHRDIKPANCFEDLDGTVKIGDFGLSISTAGRGDSMQTMDGTFLGTPAFCSPEQLRGEELNVRSDMYSVGVTLFYLLTGRTPFEGRNMVQQLASSLEKAAPSPLQYRPDMPQGLARIVLRCLYKQASERFATYQELQQALRPFASVAPTPATLGLRFAAGVIDHFILTALCFVIPLLWVDSPLDFLDPRKFHTAEFFWIVTGMFAIRHLYFGILEGIWGAAAGKALVGLRVARLNRSAPGIPRSLLRSLLLQAFATVELLRFNVTDFTQVTTWSYVWPLGQVLFFLLMFISVRRRNGFAALHDLWTSTRVIQKAAYHPRVTMTQAETVVSTTEDTPKVGPYHVLATLSRVGDQTVLLGYDTRLLRKVWIRQTPLGSPPVAQPLRNIARPGRLRWLQGERDAHESWDAYEAASGSPLTSLLTEPQPWRLVRHWLSDLTAELDAASKTSSLPDTLTLDRVWITAEGRTKLLDFPAPGSVSSAPAAESMTAQAFLHQVAIATLEGRLVSPQDAATRTLAAPLPVTARRTLLGLRSMPDLRSTATQLQVLTQQPAEISHWRRFALLFGTLAPSLLMTAFALVGLMGYQNWAAKNPALPALGRCMRSYESMQENVKPWQLKDIPAPEAKAAMETYIAETYRSLVQDAQQWESPMARAMLTPQKRAVVERIVKQHPRPSPEDVSKAKALLKPLLDVRANELNLTDKDHMLNSVGFSVLCVYLVLTALLSLFCAVVFRGGLVLRILGIAVVKNDGSDASRGRMLWRSLIAWSPILLSPFILFTLAPFIEKAGAQAMLSGKIIGIITLVVLPLALGIAAIAMRGRGLHDRLARTWLVPR